MAEVVAFGGGCIPGEPSADLVEILEGLLERARSGHLTGLAYATTAIDGAQGTGWSGVAGTRHPLGTAVMMLHHRYSAGLLERADG